MYNIFEIEDPSVNHAFIIPGLYCSVPYIPMGIGVSWVLVISGNFNAGFCKICSEMLGMFSFWDIWLFFKNSCKYHFHCRTLLTIGNPDHASPGALIQSIIGVIVLMIIALFHNNECTVLNASYTVQIVFSNKLNLFSDQGMRLL